MTTAAKKTSPRRSSRALLGTRNPVPKVSVRDHAGIKIVRSTVIRCPARTLYDFWRDPVNLTRIISQPVTIAVDGEGRSHWTVTGPMGRTVTWDALVINDHPGELIAWRSLAGSEVPNAGSVRFAPSANGEETEVTVSLEYDPPGGKLGEMVAKLARNTGAERIEDALRRLKELMESGGISRSDGPTDG